MSERSAPSRVITIGGGILAVAGLAVALTLNAGAFTSIDWILTACAAICIAFTALCAVPVRGLRMRRSGLAAEIIAVDIPIGLPLVALGGAVGLTAASLAFAVGYGTASLSRSSWRVTDLPRHGAMRALAILICLPFAPVFVRVQSMPDVQQAPYVLLWLVCAALIYRFVISAPSSAFTFHLSLGRVWERIIRDSRVWSVLAGSVLCAAVARGEVMQRHPIGAISLWLACCIVAVLMRTIDRQHAELHRLRLVRDAVQAMLGARDPLPQINAILATLRVPSQDETVSVFAAPGGRTEGWRAITTIGPALSSAGDELGRRILARMKFSGTATTTLKDDYYTAYGFGSRLNDGELHGALTVHRRSDRPLSNEQIAQFANAAMELGPLLRDMRTIAATQSAASIDGLTGLANRATTMERLHVMLDERSISETGSVLLLDVDHFKMINDHLGHAAGDECLRKIGDIIRTTVRGGDIAGRIGGEEFLVVMPGATRDVAVTVAERLRLAIALGGMRYSNGAPVTTSIGVAAARTGDTVELLLARADRGLYEAKRLGRNRIVEEPESA